MANHGGESVSNGGPRRPREGFGAARGPARGETDLIEVSQLWTALRTNVGFISKVTVLVAVAVVAATLLSQMTFRTSGRLYLGEIERKSRADAPAHGDLALNAETQTEVASEIEILRSQSLVTRAVLESGLNAAVTREGRTPPRYVDWLLSRRDPKLVDGVFDELRVSGASLSDRAAQAPRKYSVRFVGEGAYEVSEEGRLVGRGRLGEPFKNAQVSLTLAEGERGPPPSGARYEIAVRPVDRAVDDALRVLDVTAPKQGNTGELVNVLTLEFRDGSAKRAAAFLVALMNAYLAERQEWKTEDASAAEAFVGEQLSGMTKSLDDLQQRLADYRSNNEVVVAGKEAEAMVEQVGKYEEQRLAARLQVAALQDVKRALAKPNPPMGAFLMGEANDTVLQGMATSLTEARAKLADLETRFNDAAPDVKAQREKVASELSNIQSYVSSRLSRAQENLGALSSLIQQVQNKLKTVPGAEVGLAQLSRESEVFSKTYSYLLERQQQTAIIKASTLSKNRILDLPEARFREDSPRLALRFAGALGGLLLGAALVVVRSLWSGRFQTQGDVLRGACGVPVFGVVPEGKKARRKTKSEADALLAAFARDPRSDFFEAFRVLRASLRHWGMEDRGRVVLVTSPCPGDGKTTVALSLATVLAAEGKRVLVIDATPDAHVPRGVAIGATLEGVLSGARELAEALRVAPLPFGEVHVLHAGGIPRPEHASYERRRGVLQSARQRFDLVLIDAPSFPPAADAVVWAELADGVLSVMRPQHTARKVATEHLTRLSDFARAYAIVVNDAGAAGRGRLDYPLSREVEAAPVREQRISASDSLRTPSPVPLVLRNTRRGLGVALAELRDTPAPEPNV